MAIYHKSDTIFPLLLILILSISLFGNVWQMRSSLERDRVISVVDGDSFTTRDGRRIRLLGIDAPERGRCMHSEARNRLKELVAGKRVHLTDVVNDDYGRILANVWVDATLVNEVMIKDGLARYSGQRSPATEALKAASTRAKTEAVGIYSPHCRTAIGPAGCDIKGNIRAGKKMYYLPSCGSYDQVIVDEAYGDQWFCSEQEAETEGFVKAVSCVQVPSFQ